MPDHFPPGSVIRRVNEEPVALFGAGRALLLQLAHPAVAAGVDEHSDFQRNPFKRLQATLEAVYTMVYGSRRLAEGVGRRVQWIHGFVQGPGYRASDPDNLLWVHATLLDTALSCYELIVGPLSAADRETYYQEMTEVAALFGCPRHEQPADYGDFCAYWGSQIGSIEVSDVGRRLARDIIDPVLPMDLHVPLTPALRVQRRVAIGMLPEPLRDQFGFAWDAVEQRRFERVLAVARAGVRRVPHRARVAPGHLHGRVLLRRARRHVAEFDARMAADRNAGAAI